MFNTLRMKTDIPPCFFDRITARLRHGGRRDGARSGDNLRFSGIGKKQFAVHCGFHFGHNRHY